MSGTPVAALPPRPTIVPFAGLPDNAATRRLRSRDQFVTWTYVLKPGVKKWTKPPHDPRTGAQCSGTDPSNWASYDVAAATAVRMKLAGVGFALGPDDNLTGLDIDGCRDAATGQIAPRAAAILSYAETYAEISPSGTGVRLFADGKVDAAVACHPAGVEIYGAGRYLTLTGRHVAGTPAEIRQAPQTMAALLQRIETTRTEIEAKTAKLATHKKVPRPGQSFFRNVNDAALANLPMWVPQLFPTVARFMPGTGSYRIASHNLGRDLEEDLSITPGGIVDFGVHDMGDPRQGKRTPIDLVVEWTDTLEEKTPLGAARWLCSQLGVEPTDLGFGRNGNRPEIKVVNGQIRESVDAAEDALIASGGVFQRADQVVCLGEVQVLTHHKREVSARRILPLGEYALAERMAEAATFLVFDGRIEDFKVVDPPTKVVRTIMERAARCRLPYLRSVISAPTLRPDGSLLFQPGYDESTGLFYDPGSTTFPAINPKPLRNEAVAALDQLRGICGTFPFVTEADRSVVLAGIITACVRQALRTAPMFATSSPTPGTGKSKITDIYSVIATGREAGVVAQAGTEAELEKRLGALLLQGAAAIALDNCTAPIEGVFLAMLLTQVEVQVRLLGTSKVFVVPTNAFITATGNNLAVAADMTRRVLVSRMDARVERPELRKFDFDPVIRAKEDRPRLVAAALTILLAFNHAGRPAQTDPLGSFEGWSRSVRDAMIWLGCADPVGTMEAVRASDPKRVELISVLTQWREVIGDTKVTTAKIIDRATARQSTSQGLVFEYPEFREALLSIAGQAGSIDTKKLGIWIGKHINVIVNGMSITNVGAVGGSAAWKFVSDETALA